MKGMARHKERAPGAAPPPDVPTFLQPHVALLLKRGGDVLMRGRRADEQARNCCCLANPGILRLTLGFGVVEKSTRKMKTTTDAADG